MKKIFYFMFSMCIGAFVYFIYFKEEKNIYNLLDNVEGEFYIEEYSVFGTHLNIKGCYDDKLDLNSSLILKNDEDEIELKSKFYADGNRTCFKESEKNNDGIYLDGLDTGDYLLMVLSSNKYYTLNNKTEYKDIEYYTITRNNSNNKINIIFDKVKNNNYVEFKIAKSKLPDDVYDITLDAGHGGKDPGTSAKLSGKSYNEKDLTLEITLLLKSELEKEGLKVKLTRDSDTYIYPYGDEGRAVIPNSYHTKYSLSIHLNNNSSKINYGGVEIYTPNNIDYEFAETLASNISKEVGYSKKSVDKISNGIYFSYFTKTDITDSELELKGKNMKPYDIKEGAPYMFMIREVGGINTYAYVDGRNEYYGLNKFYSSNITTEPYLLELGYMNYEDDLEKLVLHPELFSSAISKSIKEYLNIS